MQCPLCDHPSHRTFMRHAYWFRACANCQHRFVELTVSANHTAQIYDDQYFTGGGAGYTDYRSEARLLRARGQWYGRVLQRYMSPGTVLDVGAAAGFILQGLLDCGWQGTGVEPNEGMARYARETVGVCVSAASIESFQSPTPYHLVTMIQVLAHCADPRSVLAKVAQLLKPGGYVLIETWNSQSVVARIFGRRWHEYSPPSVLHCFSVASLRRVTAQCGFTPVASGRPSKWISGGHAKSLLRHNLRDLPWAERLIALMPDRWLLPYPATDLFWILLKKDHA